MGHEPKGDLVTKPVPAQLPSRTKAVTKDNPNLAGGDITLVPLSLSHVPDLYANLGGPQNEHIYTYLMGDFCRNIDEFESLVNGFINAENASAFAVLSSDPQHLSNANRGAGDQSTTATPTAIAVISLLNLRPQSLAVEIGAVVFPTSLQRTASSTLIQYLVLRHVFEDLGYERVEWKCNVFNEPSMKAALRLGFKFEGVFRRHMVLKGRWRDTWWGSIIGSDWVGEEGKRGVKSRLEAWLDRGNFDEAGKMRRRLEEFVEG